MSNSYSVKILDEAIKRCGKVPTLQMELAAIGVKISTQALYSALKNSESLRFDVLCGLVRLVYNGDWSKAGKAIEEDFAPWKKR